MSPKPFSDWPDASYYPIAHGIAPEFNSILSWVFRHIAAASDIEMKQLEIMTLMLGSNFAETSFLLDKIKATTSGRATAFSALLKRRLRPDDAKLVEGAWNAAVAPVSTVRNWFAHRSWALPIHADLRDHLVLIQPGALLDADAQSRDAFDAWVALHGWEPDLLDLAEVTTQLDRSRAIVLSSAELRDLALEAHNAVGRADLIRYSVDSVLPVQQMPPDAVGELSPKRCQELQGWRDQTPLPHHKTLLGSPPQ